MKPFLSFCLCFSLLANVRGVEPKELTNSIGMKLVRIEPGSFSMGQDGPRADYSTMQHADKCDDADWDERPVHRVTISTVMHMAATEVTIAQYRQFQPKLKAIGADDEAVTGVSWHDAMKFCEWLSAKEGKTYRLPTEAEWEYACRAGTTTPFSTGVRLPDGFQKFKMNSKVIGRFFTKAKTFPPDYRDWPKEAPLRVAQTPANAWGLFDMHGNVEEWCLDWYGPYEAADALDPVGREDGDFRVTRGGSHDVFSRLLRSANRSGRIAETANDMIGFRVVLAGLPKSNPLPPPTPPLNARNVSQASAPVSEPTTQPFFSGPKLFVKVPPNLAGPMFSGHNHSPAIAECPNGDLLAVWFSCGDEGGPELAVIASRLRRGATEWEEASPFWDGADTNDHAPKLWFDGDKTLFFFAKGLSGDAMRTSTDSGATWSKPRVFQPEGEIGNQPIRTREGFIVLPLDNNKPGASLNISRDGGKTWTAEPGRGKPDFRPGGSGTRTPGIHNAIAQLADGRLMALGRFDLPAQQELFNFRIPLSYSSDWGKTWTYEASEFPAIGSVQRAVLLRLNEGPLLFCSFTDEQRYYPKRKGMKFKAADGTEFIGCGLFAAVSFDEGKTWPVRRLITPGGPERSLPSVDKREFVLSETESESAGYLAACQTRDNKVQLVSSKNHFVFNLAWLKELPAAPKTAERKPSKAAKPAPQTSAAKAKEDASAPLIKTDATGVRTARFLAAHESFLARGKSGPIDLLFIGDSITAGWVKAPHVWNASYGASNPANFGISGDQTQHVIWRITNGELDGIKPKVTVLMLGTNNTSTHTAAEIAAADKKIVALIRAKIPGTKVLLLAIFPRGARKDKAGEITEKAISDAATRTAIINAANAELAKLDDGKNVRFLDISSVFYGQDGKIPFSIMPDQLHPNAAGYQLWADAMNPLLKEMLR